MLHTCRCDIGEYITQGRTGPICKAAILYWSLILCYFMNFHYSNAFLLNKIFSVASSLFTIREAAKVIDELLSLQLQDISILTTKKFVQMVTKVIRSWKYQEETTAPAISTVKCFTSFDIWLGLLVSSVEYIWKVEASWV